MIEGRPAGCYIKLLGKIDNLELKIRRIKEQLTELRAIVSCHPGDEKDPAHRNPADASNDMERKDE
jgi:hypothetical protein